MAYKIPLFDLNFDLEEEKVAVEVIRSKWISMGEKTIAFENMFSSMLQCEHSIAVTNCTVALHLAMDLLNIGSGDEVITPSLTFVATVNAIKYVGAIPVFCDVVGMDDLTIDPMDIQSKITSRTKAIIVMHYGGFPCDMDSICKIARDNNLFIIEDACHAPLSEYAGKKVGTIGDIGCFSFYSNKNISTGEGGMLVTNNSEIAIRARLLRSHGMTTMSYDRFKGHSTSYDVVALGYNYRLDDIRAAIGIAQLGKISKDLEIRAILRSQYINKLKDIENIIIPFQKRTEFISNYILPIVLGKKYSGMQNTIREKLSDKGIQTSIHYPPVHLFDSYRKYSVELPKTEYIANNEITLPMYSKLTCDDISYICKVLAESIENCE